MARAEPKAYDSVKYRGLAGGYTIVFDFADGYPEASEIRITATGGRPRIFVLDDSGQMRFVPKSHQGANERVILKMDRDDDGPAKVEGIYQGAKDQAGPGRTVSFTLTKQ